MNRMLQACLHPPSSCKWKVPLIYLFNTQVQTHGWISRIKPSVPSSILLSKYVKMRCYTYSTSCRVPEIFQDHVKVSSNGNRCSGFRTFCTGKDLASKKCIPCNSKDIRPMTEQAAMELIPKVPEWNLVNEGGTLKLNRSWKTKSFTKGLELFQRVGDIAEAEGHHPDLHLIGWNNVKIEIWTHSAGGLTENDFILAAKIDSLDLEHLLRRKAVK